MKLKYLIDAHAHLGYWPTLKEAKHNLLASTKRHHVNFCLVSFDGSEFKNNKRDKHIDPVIQGSKKCLNFCKKHKGFGMLVWIKPRFENPIQEIDKFIEENREYIYGIKFHPTTSKLRIASKKLIPYFNVAEKYNLPILVHTAMDEYSSIIYLKKAAELHPNLIFVAAHMELFSDNKYTLNIMRNQKNIYVDTAWVDMKIVRLMKKYNLMDRIMFGTDNPIDGLYTLENPTYIKYYRNYIKLGYNDYQKLMYLNAMNVYKIPLEKLAKK